MMGIPVVFLLLVSLLVSPQAAAPRGPQTPHVARNVQAAAERKIDPQLLQEITAWRAGKKGLSEVPAAIKLDQRRRVLVDIHVPVSPASRRTVMTHGSTIVSTSVEHRSIVAWVPVIRLEMLALDPSVVSIVPAPDVTLHR